MPNRPDERDDDVIPEMSENVRNMSDENEDDEFEDTEDLDEEEADEETT